MKTLTDIDAIRRHQAIPAGNVPIVDPGTPGDAIQGVTPDDTVDLDTLQRLRRPRLGRRL